MASTRKRKKVFTPRFSLSRFRRCFAEEPRSSPSFLVLRAVRRHINDGETMEEEAQGGGASNDTPEERRKIGVAAGVFEEGRAKTDEAEGRADTSVVAKQDGASCECFVGGLAPDATEEELLSYFDDLHPISVRVNRRKRSGDCKGYGFVVFPSAEQARRACEREIVTVRLFSLSLSLSFSLPTIGDRTWNRDSLLNRMSRKGAQRVVLSVSLFFFGGGGF